MDAVFDISAYVAQVFFPCVTIGAILPAGATALAALVRAGYRSLGLVVDD